MPLCLSKLQWHRTGSRWSPFRTLPVAPLWSDLGFFPNSRGNKAAANRRPMTAPTCHRRPPGNGGPPGRPFSGWRPPVGIESVSKTVWGMSQKCLLRGLRFSALKSLGSLIISMSSKLRVLLDSNTKLQPIMYRKGQWIIDRTI